METNPMSADYTTQIHYSPVLDEWTAIVTEPDGYEVHFEFFKTEEEAQLVAAQFIDSRTHPIQLDEVTDNLEQLIYDAIVDEIRDDMKARMVACIYANNLENV